MKRKFPNRRREIEKESRARERWTIFTLASHTSIYIFIAVYRRLAPDRRGTWRDAVFVACSLFITRTYLFSFFFSFFVVLLLHWFGFRFGLGARRLPSPPLLCIMGMIHLTQSARLAVYLSLRFSAFSFISHFVLFLFLVYFIPGFISHSEPYK